MRAAKVDANQAEIVKALRKCGVSVQSTASMGNGFPDLVAGKGALTWLIEVKGPKGKLTNDQIEFIDAWNGTVHIARSIDDALRIVGVMQ